MAGDELVACFTYKPCHLFETDQAHFLCSQVISCVATSDKIIKLSIFLVFYNNILILSQPTYYYELAFFSQHVMHLIEMASTKYQFDPPKIANKYFGGKRDTT